MIDKIVLNYKMPDFMFIFYVNVKYKLKKIDCQCLSNKENLNAPRYKILDLKNHRLKYFSYRKQGLMAFGNGIFNRGETIGRAYQLDKITFNDNDIIIDAGANTGDLKIFFDNRNLKINYFGIEPGIEEFKALELNNLNCRNLNVALGNENNTATFFYKPEFGDSSLIEMEGYKYSYEMKTRKLSTVMDDLGLGESKIKLLKLDAEGGEPEVIDGIGDYLYNFMYISADLGFERGFKEETTASEVLNYLIPRGFEIIGVTKDRLCFLLRNKNL